MNIIPPKSEDSGNEVQSPKMEERKPKQIPQTVTSHFDHMVQETLKITPKTELNEIIATPLSAEYDEIEGREDFIKLAVMNATKKGTLEKGKRR